jgi:hypothetical protein
MILDGADPLTAQLEAQLFTVLSLFQQTNEVGYQTDWLRQYPISTKIYSDPLRPYLLLCDVCSQTSQRRWRTPHRYIPKMLTNGKKC